MFFREINILKSSITRELLLLAKNHYKVTGTPIERIKKLFVCVYALRTVEWSDYRDIEIHRTMWSSFMDCVRLEHELSRTTRLENIYADAIRRNVTYPIFNKDGASLTISALVEAMWGALSCMTVVGECWQINFGDPDPEIQKKLDEIEKLNKK